LSESIGYRRNATRGIGQGGVRKKRPRLAVAKALWVASSSGKVTSGRIGGGIRVSKSSWKKAGDG